MKRVLCIISVLIVLALSTGCWDRVEAKQLGILSSIIYDIDDDNEYSVIVEIRNPAAISSSTGGSSGESSRITTSAQGESFSEALRKVSLVLDKTLFGGHNEVRFLTERHAKKGVWKLLDYTSRDIIADERNFMVVIKGDDPKSIYEVKISLSDLLGQHINDLYNNQSKMNSHAVFVDTLRFLQDLMSGDKQPVAGLVEVQPSEMQLLPKIDEEDVDMDRKLVYSGLAAFKEDKLVGYFNEEEARAYNYFTNNIKRTFVSVEEQDFHIAAVITNSNCKVKANPKGDNFIFDVDFAIKLRITQAYGDFDIMKIELEDYIAKKFNEKISEELLNAITKSQQEFKSDIFGFGGYIHRQHPQLWKTVKENWAEMYPEAEMNININSNIKLVGQIGKSARFLKENQ